MVARVPAARLVHHLLGQERSLQPHENQILPVMVWNPQLVGQLLSQPLTLPEGHLSVGPA